MLFKYLHETKQCQTELRENTYVTGGRRQVDLDDVCRGKDRLPRIEVTDSSAGSVSV